MTETFWLGIISTVISVASVLLGVFVTQYYESRKRESEERRWYADYFLGRKIEALSNLYAALLDCYSTMLFYGSSPPSTVGEYKEEVRPKEAAYWRAKAMASVYLDDKANEIMSRALGAFKLAGMAIWLSLPNDQCRASKDLYGASIRDMDWERFSDAYKEAVACLRDMLNPQGLEHVGKPKRMQ